jgi:hypothetical protein
MSPAQPEQACDHDGGEAGKTVGQHHKDIWHVTHATVPAASLLRPLYQSWPAPAFPPQGNGRRANQAFGCAPYAHRELLQCTRTPQRLLEVDGIGKTRLDYGADTLLLVKQNAYRLARDIRGIGFKTADQLAQKLGIPKTSMLRAAGRHLLCAAAGGRERRLWLAGRGPTARSCLRSTAHSRRGAGAGDGRGWRAKEPI